MNLAFLSLLFLCIVSNQQLETRSTLSLPRIKTRELKTESVSLGIGHVILRRAIFDRKRLFISGDIHVHPGPSDKGPTANKRFVRFPCLSCGKGVTARSWAIGCDGCDEWTHIQCTDGEISRERYDAVVTEDIEFSFNCRLCSISRGFSELPLHNDNDDVRGDGDATIQREVDGGEEVADGDGVVGGDGQTADDTGASRIASSSIDSASTGTRSISDSDLANFHRKGMSFIHLNVRSLLPKISELSVILHRTKASVMAVSETHLDSSISNNEVNIQGYTMIRRDRNRSGGGVCLFIKDTVSFNVRQDLEEENFEAVFVDILFPKSRPFLVGVCYRPPSDCNFLAKFRGVIDRLDLANEAYILGDFNVCMSKAQSSLARQYLGILNSFSFTQLITDPTRITASTKSILDHILTNSVSKVVKSGVLDWSLSDHQAVFFIRGRPPGGGGGDVRNRRRRVMKGYSKERLCDELGNMDWSPVVFAIDVNLALENFYQMFISVIDNIAPYREFRPKHFSSPWMCGEILAGIKKRDSLFAKFKKDRNNQDIYRQYCAQRNKVQREVKFAKSNYFRRKIDESGSDSGKLWRQLGSLGHSKKGGAEGSIVLESGGSKFFSFPDVSRMFICSC